MRLRQEAWLVVSLATTLMIGASPALAATPVEAASDALQAGNASNAVVLATQALTDSGLTVRDRARVLTDRGLAHEILTERDAALIDLTDAINLHALPTPEQAKAFYDRGVTLDELGRTQDAAGDYSAAIRIEPKFAAALNNRGNAYRRLNRLEAARADYLASIAAGNLHPEYPNYGLGQIAEAAGRTDQARAYYQAALAANPLFAIAAERVRVMGPAFADAPVPPAGDAAVHLRPPRGSAVHLHMPGERPPHLHAPHTAASTWPAAPPPAAPQPSFEPDLKPAIAEGGGARGTIQLGAWRNESDAADAWNRISGASGDLLAGLSPQVITVDLPGKGRYYRLRAGPVEPGNAASLCAALVAKSIACMVPN